MLGAQKSRVPGAPKMSMAVRARGPCPGGPQIRGCAWWIAGRWPATMQQASSRPWRTQRGALGFWQAVEEVWPRTRGQRCWVHKTANVLNKLPKSQQSKAKRALQEIWMAE